MPTSEKIKIVEELKRSLSSNDLVISTGYKGLGVDEMTDLRRKIRDCGAQYKVAKNSLLLLASVESGKGDLKDILSGPTGIVIGNVDVSAVAKVLDRFIKDTKAPLIIHGAIHEGRIITGDQLKSIADLPSKDVLVAMLLTNLNGPLANLVSLLSSQISSLTTVLQRRVEQIESASSKGD